MRFRLDPIIRDEHDAPLKFQTPAGSADVTLGDFLIMSLIASGASVPEGEKLPRYALYHKIRNTPPSPKGWFVDFDAEDLVLLKKVALQAGTVLAAGQAIEFLKHPHGTPAFNPDSYKDVSA